MTQGTTSDRSNTRKALPVDRPILVRFDEPPRAGRTTVNKWSKKEVPMAQWRFRVDHVSYPQFDGQMVFMETNDKIKAGGGEFRPTNSFKLIRAMVGVEEAMTFNRKLCSQLTPEEAAVLFGHYVVYMAEPKVDEQGRLWQDIKELKHPDALEWNASQKRMDQETMRKYIGMPIPVNRPVPPEAPPELAPAPIEPVTLPAPEPTPYERAVSAIRSYTDRKNGFNSLAKAFLAAAGAARVGDLELAQMHHLLDLLRIYEAQGRSEATAKVVTGWLRDRQLVQLDPRSAKTLLQALTQSTRAS